MKERLDGAYCQAHRLEIDSKSKLVFMSDCHRGVGDHIDNFLPNQNLFFAALNYYYENQFVYVELGDGDELWENRSLNRIIDIHSDVFWLISQFYQKGRFYMLYGNHDRKKKDQRYLKAHFDEYYDTVQDKYKDLLKGMMVHESMVLTDKAAGFEILLVHGHQGDLLNDKLWLLARFLVRYIWRPLEFLGVYDPTSAARNYKERKKTERHLDKWAKEQNVMVIAGHTHRPILPQPGESLYLNDGSCVHPRCITAMELEYGYVTLVKWSVMVRYGRQLSVEREILEGPVKLSRYWT